MKIRIPGSLYKKDLDFLNDRTCWHLGIWGEIIWSLNFLIEKDGK